MESVLAEAVVGKVCEMAVQQVANEVSIVFNFAEDFERLTSRIEEINCALSEADEESSRQKESAKKWLHRVREIAWEADDILEESAVDSLYSSNTQSCALGCRQLILRHKMGRRIQKVKASLGSIVEEGNQLNVVRAVAHHREAEGETSSSSQRKDYRRSSLLPSDSYPVGIQSKIESMVTLVENPQIPIVAVVGMGGMGKTYLLQQVYDRIKGRYEKSAWLSVSQFYSVSKLIGDLALQLDKELSREIQDSRVSEVVAAQLIHDFMLEKRCLVVLDDMWRATREGDLLTRLGLPGGHTSQCTVLVSTRNRDVCRILRAYIYEMEYLTEEESWRLFCAYAFGGYEGNRWPEHLVEVARDIVKECGKLPLAIKTTAASLASCTLLSEWRSKLRKLKKVSTLSDPIIDILKLSYDSLPAHLRDCFAYLSFFPEDAKIECEYLMYLWMGEGFIPAGQNPGEKDCLDQLANLCLVEVWEDRELTKYCKIHDLLLDLAILICKENKCAFDLDVAFSELRSENTGGARWCRLFLAKKDIGARFSQMRPVSSTQLVRTLCLSGNSKIEGKIPGMLFGGMKALRVLDLSDTHISKLPACVGEMKLLKVLNLRGTMIEKLPECVRHLRSLSYLNVSGCHRFRQSEAPKWISELRCLQHLKGAFERMPKGIIKLQSLRTLRTGFLFLSTEEDGVLRLEGIGQMRRIEEISFIVSDASQLRMMEQGILANLEKMRRLRVRNFIDEMPSDLPQFPERLCAMRDLESLSLYTFEVPRWIRCLTNLRKLQLCGCDCSEYPELQEMPSLVCLVLSGNSRCREVPKAFGKSGGFPRLRFLSIYSFDELEEFPEMEDGAMPCLEILVIEECEKLNKVGEGLERLKRLKEISFACYTGTDELREGGTHSKRIKDVNPHITVRT